MIGNALPHGPFRQVQDSIGARFFFKPRLDLMGPELDREVAVLEVIRQQGLDKKLRISQFRRLVLLQDGLVEGMLFDWLCGAPLAKTPRVDEPRLQRRWREQVERIVAELHRRGVVWGDVNVHNIFVDEDDDAWVIDFGGSDDVQFINQELKETVEGDWQGVRRIFDEWLPGRHTS